MREISKNLYFVKTFHTLVVVNVRVLVELSTLVTYLVDSIGEFESINDGICVESVKNIVVAPEDTRLIAVFMGFIVLITLEVRTGVGR